VELFGVNGSKWGLEVRAKGPEIIFTSCFLPPTSMLGVGQVMRRYLIRYLIFWAPAVLTAFILTLLSNTLLIVAQWFFGFFMLLAWAFNTGMFTYNHPRGALVFVLAFPGVNALLITALAEASYSTATYSILVLMAGAFTFRPLHMLYESIRETSSFPEMLIAGIITAACVVGFIWGVLYRLVRPDPYRPTFIR